jgi:hypothetical protein
LLPKRSNDSERLWIIVAEIGQASGKAICVNVATEQADSDITCQLNKGDHGFVKQCVSDLLPGREGDRPHNGRESLGLKLETRNIPAPSLFAIT